MRVTRVTDLYPVFLPPPEQPRSPGIHLSGVIRAIATEAGILKGGVDEEVGLLDVREIVDPVALLRINIGLAWEVHYIQKILPDVVDHPGEIRLDGIYMTPDGESISAIVGECNLYTLMCHEVKATYKSTRTVGDLTQQWMWIAQIKAYCKALGTKFARLHILFICGDYTFPIRPVREVYEIEFTQEEIDDNWNTLTSYVQKRINKKA